MANVSIGNRITTYCYKDREFELCAAHIDGEIDSELLNRNGFVAIDHKYIDGNQVAKALNLMQLHYNNTVSEVIDSVNQMVDVEGMSQEEMLDYLMRKYATA